MTPSFGGYGGGSGGGYDNEWLKRWMQQQRFRGQSSYVPRSNWNPSRFATTSPTMNPMFNPGLARGMVANLPREMSLVQRADLQGQRNALRGGAGAYGSTVSQPSSSSDFLNSGGKYGPAQ